MKYKKYSFRNAEVIFENDENIKKIILKYYMF